MKTKLKLAFLIISVVGCRSNTPIFPDTSSFELANVWSSLSDIKPANPVDYMELRRSFGETQPGIEGFSVVDSIGVKCNNDTICQASLDHLATQQHGFNQACLPGLCYFYVVSTSGRDVEVWESVERLRQLFGEVDTKGEAILLAFASGYWFNSIDHEVSGVKITQDGYQVVCTKMVAFCTPIITNLYLLQILKNGEVKIMNQKEYKRENEMCI